MRRKGRSNKGSGPKVPAYIVTFSDMVTLLLTFFVMLLSLAKTPSPELFHKGQGAFLNSLKNLGLGMLSGRKMTVNLGETKVKYSIKTPDKGVEVRTINAQEEGIRQVFREVSRSMRTMPSQIVAKKTNFTVTNISFLRGQTGLNEPATKFLTKFSQDLQQGAGIGEIKLYVLGLARDVRDEKEQWILSARRAQQVCDFLSGILPAELRWPVYSWGAGPGGHWVSENSLVSEHSQILLAVLRTTD